MSVLAVFVTRVDPNYAQPWQKCPQRSATGSAFVLDVEKHIIVTNAHVVGFSTGVWRQVMLLTVQWGTGCLMSLEADM
jgi:S1-C subfamily serine protease